MDNVRFAKLVREARLTSGAAGRADADLVFSRVKQMGERRINYDQFEQAVLLLGALRLVCVAAWVRSSLGALKLGTLGQLEFSNRIEEHFRIHVVSHALISTRWC